MQNKIFFRALATLVFLVQAPQVLAFCGDSEFSWSIFRKSPYPANLSNFGDSIFLSPASALQAIVTEEKELGDLRLQILNKYSTEDFYLNVVNPLQGGHAIQEVEKYLNEWETQASLLHRRRLGLIATKQRYHVLLTHMAIKKVGSEESHSFLRPDVDSTDSLFFKWAKCSDSFSEGADPRDQSSRKKYFRIYNKVIRDLLTQIELAPPLQSKWNPSFAERTLGNAQLKTALANITGQLLTRAPYNVAIGKNLISNYTPLNTLHSGMAAFSGLKRMQGYQVRVLGKDNLSKINVNFNNSPWFGKSNRKRVVNFFLPSHRTEVVDGIALAALNLPHFLIFAKPDAILNHPIATWLISNAPEVIGVIKGGKSMDKLVKSLKQGRSPNVISYPQGFVSDIGEVLPVLPVFVQNNLARLLREGFEVNLIPISYEIGSDFFSKTKGYFGKMNGVDETEILVTIHPPILHPAVQALVNYQLQAMAFKKEGPEPRYIDHFLNSLWLENIQRHAELPMQTMIQRTQDALGLTLETGNSWKNLVDQVETATPITDRQK